MNGPLDDVRGDVRYARTRLIQDRYVNYRKTVDTIFGNDPTLNLSSVSAHAECLDMEEDLVKMDDLFILIAELGGNISRSLSYQEAYSYAIQIPPLYQMRKQKYDPAEFDDILDRVRTTCHWLSDFGHEASSAAKEVLDDFKIITDERDWALRKFDDIGKLFSRLNNEVI